MTAGKYNDGTPKARAELAERLFAGMKASVAATRLVPADCLQWHVTPVSLVAREDGRYDPVKNRATLADPDATPESRISAASRLASFERLQQPIELSLVRIGPARILHLPGEPMIEFQHFAGRSLPDEFVAVAGYGIGTPGYVCTEESFHEGGYEPSASAIVPESEKVIKKAIGDLLAR